MGVETDSQKWPRPTLHAAPRPTVGCTGEPRSDVSYCVLPGNYTSRVWEYSSTIQSSDDLPAVQGSSSFSLKGELSLPCPAFPVPH